MIGRNLLFISLTILFLGFFLYVPLPPGTKNPWIIRAISLAMDAGMTISYISEKVTGKPMADTINQLINIGNMTVHQNYPELQVDDMVLDSVSVSVFRRRDLTGLSPSVVYLHGGGWVLCGLGMYDSMLTQMARETKMIIVAVRYRCAPQHPYPIPFEDSLKAVTYVLQNGETLGVDVHRVVIAGDSAGGNLAAAVSLKLSQSKPGQLPAIRAQVLINPVTQALSFNTRSYRDNGAWYLKREWMPYFAAAYMGLDLKPETYSLMTQDAHVSPSIQRSIYGSYINKVRGRKVSDKFDTKLAEQVDRLVVEPFMFPLMAKDLSKVPPAYVVVSEMDVLRDDGEMYAERLKQAGVETEVWLRKGEPHIIPFYHQELCTYVINYINKWI